MPVVLWNRTDPEATSAIRGRLEQGGGVWVAEGVTQADQGNYITRNASGNVLTHSRLTVLGETVDDSELIGWAQGLLSSNACLYLCLSISHSLTLFITRQPAHSFHFSRLIKDSVNLPLPVPHGILTFSSTKHSDQSEAMSHYGPAQLVHDGEVTNSDVRFRDLITLKGNGSKKEIIIGNLKSSHSGLYEIRDRSHNLVSSTVLQVAGGSQVALKCP